MVEPDYPGQDLLGGGSPRDILARLIDGDPLEIGPRCQDRLRDRAILLDPGRVHLRAVARVAHAAPRRRDPLHLDDWIRDRIDQSIADLLAEDREAILSGLPPEPPVDPRLAFLSEILGLETPLARTACSRFNALPEEVRQTWFAIAVDGKTVHSYATEGNGPPAKVRADLERALQALGLARGPDFGDNPPGGRRVR